ncbi:PREDICTED: ABSCISIC ACID-INSENSITIVE 5-like protein 2 isoform X2 [Lupinus angustifolius]|uniref:ABSCISIC ACID-INSENSITIVE 5-like protein 2 isoform X2 n=1 Tax=Lupinus angustifolius TaxID=3871 RepID=UPI00092EEB44|nr:PREDICTED: ABSCISIC ACID-INSENSITIVE 5-like protein 2 isoform X2 [Lupinus angustifolius]
MMGSQGGEIQGPNTSYGSLARQGSLYNLTLDEVQNHIGNLGKPLGSMNLDEFLKTVWTAEVSQVQPSGLGSGNMQQGQNELASVSSLNPQGSLTLSMDLSKKTVDEVWRDIQQRKSSTSEDKKSQDTEPILGEMTLEDFLFKAGVEVDANVASQHSASQQGHWMQYQLPSMKKPNQHQNQENNMMTCFIAGPAVQQSFHVAMNPGYSETMMAMSPSSLMGTLSDPQAQGRKRDASGIVVEKTVERRQKRMIKNRESAARSRARKQAYTQELEIKVSRLEEENERLRRRHEIERALPSLPSPDPKNQLRRTSSAPL